MRKPLNLFDLKDRYNSLAVILRNRYSIGTAPMPSSAIGDIANLLNLTDTLLDELSWLHDERKL